jgi:hypothetical protein
LPLDVASHSWQIRLAEKEINLMMQIFVDIHVTEDFLLQSISEDLLGVSLCLFLFFKKCFLIKPWDKPA